LAAAQQRHRGHRESIEDPSGEDNVGEKLLITAGDGERRRPHALHEKRERGRAVALAHFAERARE
jgi:hypothetical protein